MTDSKHSSKKESEENKTEDGKSLLGDALKKVFTVGVSTAFMTEESIRNYLGDIKLPKELLHALLQNASKSKDEITQRMSKELVSMIQKIDLVKEFSKFAETHKFKISAEVEILKKESSTKDQPPEN